MKKIESTSEMNPKFYEGPRDYMFMTSMAKFVFAEFYRELGTRSLQGVVRLPLQLPTSEISLAINL